VNFNFFNDIKPEYIAVNNDGFTVKGKIYPELECFIREIIPVRKLFRGKKIECYSNDAKKGKNGEHCVLCCKRTECRPRIRLMMMVHNGDEETPAQLEINTNSFDNLRKTIEPVSDNNLSEQLINLKIKKQGKYLQVIFNAIF
jgi:hypothetical protein